MRGAIDNCTGMARCCPSPRPSSDAPLAYTVVFAAWDAEEVGLTGSYDWVKRHPELIGDVVVDENLEMTAADAGAAALRIGTSSPAMNAIIAQAAAANGYTPADVPVGYVRSISGGIIPMDLQPFYSAGAQGFTTFTSTPWYHTAQDLPEHVDPGSLTRVSGYLRDALIGLQAAPPEALAKREVPSVTVRAPERAAAGAAVTVDIAVADPAGHPITGVPVRVVVSQNDHWALARRSPPSSATAATATRSPPASPMPTGRRSRRPSISRPTSPRATRRWTRRRAA